MVMLIFDKGIIEDFAQLRKGIEALGPEVYEKLSYYERWASSAAAHAMDKGLVTRAELDERIADIHSRGKA